MIKEDVDKMMNELREFPQYEDIPYAGDFKCPNCGKSGDGFTHVPGEGYVPIQSAKLIGYCYSNVSGYQMVYECPVCHNKFRYHNCTTERSNFEDFKLALLLTWKLQQG